MKVTYLDNVRKGNKMNKGEILYNLEGLQNGEKVNIYSKAEDMFGNEKVDIYCIEKDKDKLFVVYDKKNSLDGKAGYYYKERINSIGVSTYVIDRWEKMNLSSSEIAALRESSLESNIIRMGYDLEGVYESGLEFTFRNIILVTKDM